MPVTLEQIQAEAPELLATLRSEGATAERERIQAVRAQSLPGHDALIDALAFDGRTTGPEAAVAVLNAERSIAAGRRQALADDTPAPLPADASASPSTEAPAAEPKHTPMQQARALATAIAAQQATARAAGRNLSAVDALALVNLEH